MAQILFGIINDSGGLELVGGHPVPVNPWGPGDVDILLGVAANRIASLISNKEEIKLQKAALEESFKLQVI